MSKTWEKVIFRISTAENKNDVLFWQAIYWSMTMICFTENLLVSFILGHLKRWGVEKRWDGADTMLTAQWRTWSFNETLFHFTLGS